MYQAYQGTVTGKLRDSIAYKVPVIGTTPSLSPLHMCQVNTVRLREPNTFEERRDLSLNVFVAVGQMIVKS